MAQLTFHGAFTLVFANPMVDGQWDATINFRDGENKYTALQLKVGDVLLIDTTAIEVGTITRYEVTTVVMSNWFGQARVIIKYMEDNSNLVPDPDLSWVSGQDGVITRPSVNNKLLSVTSSELQRLSDRFNTYIHNYNTQSILDNVSKVVGFDDLPNIGLITIKLPINEDGISLFNNKPLGDVLFNMAMLHLRDGSFLEVTGVSVVEVNDGWGVQLEAADYEMFKGEVTHLTVSYMGLLTDARQPLENAITETNLEDFSN